MNISRWIDVMRSFVLGIGDNRNKNKMVQVTSAILLPAMILSSIGVGHVDEFLLLSECCRLS